MFRIALFAGALACAALGGALIATTSDPAPAVPATAVAAEADAPAAPSTKAVVRTPARDPLYAALASEVAELRAEVAREPAAREPEPELSGEEHLERARVWQEGYAHQLDSVFGEDAADGDALQAEARASKLLSELAPASSHVEVSCRAMLCRAEVHHSAAADHEALTMRVTETLAVDTPAFFVPIDDDGKPRTVVYLARAGYDLPSPE